MVDRDRVRNAILNLLESEFGILPAVALSSPNLYGSEIDSFEFLSLLMGLERIKDELDLSLDIEEALSSGEITVEDLVEKFMNHSANN